MTPDPGLEVRLADPATPDAIRIADHEAAAALQADPAARRFHLTRAWVHALVAGDDAATTRLEAALRASGGL